MKAKLTNLFCALFSFLLLAFLLPPIAQAYNGDVIVYVTNTGTVYHRYGCTYLKSQQAITLKDAVSDGYKPCSRCNPAILGKDQDNDTDPYEPPPYRPSNSDNSNSDSEVMTIPTPPKANDKERPEANPNVLDVIVVAILILVFTPIGWLPLSWIVGFIQHRKEASTIKALAVQQRIDYERRRAEVLEMYSGKSLDELAPIPPGVFVGLDGYPRGPGNGKWGHGYTFYRSKKGKCFHSSTHCTRGATVPINAITARGYIPCRRCNPLLPDLRWYYERQRIKTECAAYGFTIPEHPPQIEGPSLPSQEDDKESNEQSSFF